jgi:hypothetical protein
MRAHNFVNVTPLQLGEEVARIHLSWLLGSNMLSSSEQLLKTGIIAEGVPGWINF